MSTSGIPTNPTALNVAQLLPKFEDADSDIRFMSLNDLFSILSVASPTIFTNEYNTCARVIDAMLKSLDDQNGDVQSQALKCLGPLALKAPTEILPPFIEKLSNIKPTTSLDTSIPSTSLRTLVVSVPRPIPGLPYSKVTTDWYSAFSKVLIPRLLGYVVLPLGLKNLPSPPRGMLEADPEKGADSDAIDVAIELVRCFGPMLHDTEKSAINKRLIEILENDRTGNVTKKKAVLAISTLVVFLSDSLLNTFIANLIGSYRKGRLQRRLLITVIGSLARSIPQRLGHFLDSLAPIIFTALSKEEYDATFQDMVEETSVDPAAEEVKEAALVTLESFLVSCSNEMRSYTDEAIGSSLRYLGYNPTLAMQEDEETMDGNDDDDEFETGESSEIADEDFEEEGGMSDDDDTSWKIRRCAAKVLYSIIMTRGNGDLLDNGTLYERVAPVLVKCFKEREENVRLEILGTLAALIKKTGEAVSIGSIATDDEGYVSASSTSRSRKRRRSGSDASMFDASGFSPSPQALASPAQSPSPTSSPRSDLARLSPTMIQGVAKLLRSKSLPTKQAATTLLRDFVQVQPGGLSDHLGLIMDPIVDFIKTSGTLGIGSNAIGTGGATSATDGSLRIEVMQLVNSICATHTTKALAPYVGKLIPGLVIAVGDKYFKVSSEALHVMEKIVTVMTPPRSSSMEGQFTTYLHDIFGVIVDRASANNADLEVRQRAIHALGVIIARTSGSHKVVLLPMLKRYKGLDILHDRLKNETTRVKAIQAINTVAASLTDKDQLQSQWVQNVVIELAGQLRKSDRTIRDTSLKALKHLVGNSTVLDNLDDDVVRRLVHMLLPLLDTGGLNLLGLAMGILTELAKRNPETVIDEDLKNALCRVALAPLGATVLDSFLKLVDAIGTSGAGQPLMQGLLNNVGVTGDPAVVGAAIGTLLVSGTSTVGIRIQDFVNELQSAEDDRRKCLALSVLGEASLRFGASSSLESQIFTDQFKSKSEVVPRAAAVALGRAGAGNAPKYLPVILSSMRKSGNAQYLLLHSIKEILRCASKEKIDLSNYTEEIWRKLLSTSEKEDNKAVGAECIGRLITIEPRKYFLLLQTYLKDPTPTVRGMVIQAVRFAFTDTDKEFDRVLKPLLIGMLSEMLTDPAIENRRLALTTLNSATQNKAALVLPQLSRLLPLVIKESIINPALVREVQMGPFKHKVDDGLEVRKSAYETLNALMDTAFSRMNVADLFDRVIAGLDDEHDIKVLCNLMITKLIVLAPEETVRRLDPIAERFQAILAFKPKENAVKQEVEKAQEASKGVLRVTVRLHTAFPGVSSGATNGQVQCQVWRGYWEWVGKDFKSQLQAMEMDIKSQST